MERACAAKKARNHLYMLKLSIVGSRGLGLILNLFVTSPLPPSFGIPRGRTVMVTADSATQAIQADQLALAIKRHAK